MGDENGYVSRAEHNEFARRIESSIDQIKEDVNEMGEVVRNMNSLSLSVERMAVSHQRIGKPRRRKMASSRLVRPDRNHRRRVRVLA